jgi:hypothetical protein
VYPLSYPFNFSPTSVHPVRQFPYPPPFQTLPPCLKILHPIIQSHHRTLLTCSPAQPEQPQPLSKPLRRFTHYQPFHYPIHPNPPRPTRTRPNNRHPRPIHPLYHAQDPDLPPLRPNPLLRRQLQKQRQQQHLHRIWLSAPARLLASVPADYVHPPPRGTPVIFACGMRNRGV